MFEWEVISLFLAQLKVGDKKKALFMVKVRYLEEEQSKYLQWQMKIKLVTVGLGEAQWGRELEAEGNSRDISSSCSLFS